MTNDTPEPIVSRIAAHGSEEEAEVVAICEAVRALFADYVTEHPDPRHAMSMMMTALPMYAGTLFATLQFMGVVTAQDTARMAKMVQTNFRSGIKVGLTRATRVSKETGFGGAVQ